MIEAVVIENRRKAPQNTPLRRCQIRASAGVTPVSLALTPERCAAISGFQGSEYGAGINPPVIPGPFGNAK